MDDGDITCTGLPMVYFVDPLPAELIAENVAIFVVPAYPVTCMVCPLPGPPVNVRTSPLYAPSTVLESEESFACVVELSVDATCCSVPLSATVNAAEGVVTVTATELVFVELT
jgi:hypothetical protein